MPQPNKIPLAFAASGDKNTIPKSTETTGLASWREGFPAITSAPFSEGGIAPKRADFNGIFNALSQAVMWMQQGGVYAYDVNTDYEAGNVVLDAGGLYVANTANGPSSAVVQPSSDTTGATWKLVRLDLATQSAAGYMSAEDKAALDGVPTTYLPLSGGTLTGALKTSVVSVMPGTGDAIAVANNEGRLSFCGGTQYAQGARALIYGTQNTNNPGEFILEATNGSVFKSLNGKPDGTLTWGGKSIVDNGIFNKMFFSQTSGSYTAPYTGVYRITLKGGGGGGSGADNTIQWTGAGGGEGGTIVFYKTLTNGQSYPYIIGAGGAAGANKLDASGTAGYGGAGGTSSFNGEYTVSGASTAYPAGTGTRGGTGGRTYTAPTGATAHFIPGASGAGGLGYYGKPNGTGNDVLVNSLGYSVGGGNGGGFYDSPAVYGGGGGGGRGTMQPSAGGAGYILIEFAG